MKFFGLFKKRKKEVQKDSSSLRKNVNQQSDILIGLINESLEIAKVSPTLEAKKARLDFAMKKVIELIALANRHPYIATKKLANIYSSIREVRNDIKSMETIMVRVGKKEVA